jgi:predicted nuclease of restriction endonuclease-like RecB superfamily
VLPWSLARFKLAKNKVVPLFWEDPDIVEEILSKFKVGLTLGEIKEELKYLEKIYDYKLVRGIFKVIAKYTKFEEDSPVDPLVIRRKLYEYGPVIDAEEREKVVEKISLELGIDPIKYMFSDLEDERKITELPPLTPQDVIKAYNLSLLQTLLFKAYKLSVYVSSNWKEIVRRAKWLGLMYFAYKPLRLEFIGPATLLKMSEKYGRNFAILLPYIVSTEHWRIEADIVLGKKKKRIYKLEVEDYKDILKEIVDEKVFDSSVEERFYYEFNSLSSGWKLLREPEPIVVGDKIFIPDFLAEKGNLKVYIEIVGFWTDDYIREKVRKLKEVKEPILILLNEELSLGDYDGDNVIKFKKKVDVMKVYKWLKDLETKSLENVKIEYSLNKDVVSIKEIAEELKVPTNLIRKNLRQFPGYVFLKNYYIKEELLEKLREVDFNGESLSSLRSKYGDYIVEVLEYLGYKIVWKNITDAVAIRQNGGTEKR